MMDEREREEQVWRYLKEDAGEEAESLRETAAALSRWPGPEADAAATEQLVELLRPQMPAQPWPRRLRNWWASWWPWLLVRSQMRVVRQEIWLASALVMGLGVLVTLAMQPAAALAPATLPFVMLAPVAAAIGVAFLYGPADEGAMELELATAVSPRLILLARLALLFGFDLVLGVVGSAALSVWSDGLSLWPLLLAWLAPMTFLSALAFLLSVIAFDPLLAVLISLLLWGYQAIRSFSESLPSLVWLPNLMAVELRPWLWLSALLLGGFALWLAGREERAVTYSGGW